MKKRKITIVILGVFLAVNLLANVYLFNETVKAEALSSEAQAQLDENTANLEANKNTLQELNASIETAKKENATLLSQVPADPNKVLPNGMILSDVKKQIDAQRKANTKAGLSDEENNEMIAGLAQQLGTSLDELSKLPATGPVPVVSAAPSGNAGSGSSTVKASSGTTTQKSSSTVSSGGSTQTQQKSQTKVAPTQQSSTPTAKVGADGRPTSGRGNATGTQVTGGEQDKASGDSMHRAAGN